MTQKYSEDTWENEPSAGNAKRTAQVQACIYANMKALGLRPVQVKDLAMRKAYSKWLADNK